MSRRTYWLLVSWLGVSLTAQAQTPRIVDGADTQAGDWPFIMHMINPRQASGSQHICGGGYLGDGIAVTAKHCISDAEILGNQVCLGNKLSSNRNNCYAIIDYQTFNGNQSDGVFVSGDIALLRLAGVPAEQPVMTLATLSDEAAMLEDEPLTLLGYGSTSYDSYIPSDKLLQRIVLRQSDAACEQKLGLAAGSMEADYLCAMRAPYGSAPGDSGTPIFYWRNNVPISAGLVSNGQDNITRYVRYGYYHSWIASVAQQWLGTTLTSQYQLLLPDDPHPQVTLRLSNWSATASELLDLSSIPDLALEPQDQQCSTLAINGHCHQVLDLKQPFNGRYSGQLSYQLDDTRYSVDLTLDMAEAVVVPEGWPQSDITWWSGGDQPWQASEDGMVAGNVPATGHSVLATQLQGPGILEFTVQQGTKPTHGRLQILLDEVPALALSGYCQTQAYSLAIPQGEHRVTWQWQRENSNSGSSERPRLSAVTWPTGISHLQEPVCSLEATANEEANSNSGGGAAGGLCVLLALMSLARRNIGR